MTEAEQALEASDRAARERALDPTRSILLEAPAGSGKTTVLTQRMLRLLAGVDEPEEVLAITFTRKAAAEMRERVLDALRAPAAGSSEQAQRTHELALAVRRHAARLEWGLEQNPARLRIQTIDALNHSIASRLPVAARAGGRLRVHERPQALYRLAARRTLEDAEQSSALQADAGLLFERLDNDWSRFERLLAEMLARRAHWLPLLLRGAERPLGEAVETALERVVGEALGRTAAAVSPELLAEVAHFAPLHARKLGGTLAARLQGGERWPEPLGADATQLPWWRCLASLALTEAGTPRKRLTVAQGFAPENAAAKAAAVAWIEALCRRTGALEALAEVAELPAIRLEPDDAAALEALSRVLHFAAAQLEVVFREQGQVDHSYVAAAARRALTEDGEPTDLALRLGAGLRHLLIDEFQDTSSEQFALVEALTAGWEEGDGRSLFLVGDPMQSIYQFREAEVGLFLRARSVGVGSLKLEALRLSRNFRSAPALVDWTNVQFARMFPAADDPRLSAVRHAPSVAGRPPATPAVIGLHRTPLGERATEATLIAELVADMRRRDPAGSIAILVAARQHAAPITRALLAAGIPVAGVDLVPLAELPVVRDLAALARALDHPADRTAWLALLRAPWCGLTLAELALLGDRHEPLTVWEALQSGPHLDAFAAPARARLERVAGVLARAFADAPRLAFGAWVEATWLALGGPSACRDAEELAHAEAFLKALSRRALEPDWSGPQDLDELLAALFATPAAAAPEAVQIMTMHRAKGLEFDRVILPGLGRRPGGSGEPLLRWLDLPRAREGSDLLLAPSPTATGERLDPLNRYLKRLARQRSDFERVRLLYVATTRARLELQLIGQTSVKHPERAPAGTLLASFWPVLGEAFLAAPERAAPQSTSSPATEAGAPRRLRRLSAEWQPPSLPAPPPFVGLEVANYEPETGVKIDWAGETARDIGTVVHAALARLALGAAAAWESVAPTSVSTAELRAELVALGVAGEELADATRTAAAAITTTLGDPRGRWVLDPRHREAASELPLSGIFEGRLVNVIIDRSFIDAEGIRWVIDFKTSTPHGDDLEAFVATELELYRPQLEKYVALASALGPEPVRAALYFPRLALFRECSRRRADNDRRML
jgi:ATP-dependent exoDNAse (exonuclease V) beta subunit